MLRQLEEMLRSGIQVVRKRDLSREKAEGVGEATPTESLEPHWNAKNAFAVLFDALYFCCSLHNVAFLEMTEEHNVNHG